MKVNPKFLIMMAALVGGSALAAPPFDRTDNLTNAGTVITNVATASYTDPTTSTTKTEPSNPVTTTVSAKNGFNITYADGGDTDKTDTPAGAIYKLANVLPGEYVAFEYAAVNDGNASQTITLTTDKTPTIGTVTYYKGRVKDALDSEGAVTGGTVLTGNQITVLPSGYDPLTNTTGNTGIEYFTMVYRVPTTTPVNTTVGATPIGTALVWDPATKTNVLATEKKDVEAATPAYDDLWWQYNSVTTFQPTVTNLPPTLPATTVVVVPPTNANPGTPASPVSPPGTTGAGTDPSVSGYVDPTQTPTSANPGTSIAVDAVGNKQSAYPPADSNAVVDKVTFNNVVSTPVDAATPTDTISLFPTVGINNGDGTFTVAASGGNPGYTVSFTDANGNPLLTAINTADGKTYPYVTIPKGGGSVPYRTVVTYDDSNPNTDTTTLDNPVPIVVVIAADSGNDSDITADATTTDTIYPAAAAFGDVVDTDPNPNKTYIGPGNLAQTVVAGINITIGKPDPAKEDDNIAVFPMIIKNTGEYADTYLLTGSVPIKLSNGSVVSVPVKYTDAAGNELPKNTSGVDSQGKPLPAKLADGVTDAIYYVTPRMVDNSQTTVYANVVVPAGAALTTGANGTTGVNPQPLVSQTAKGNYSTIVLTDNNDQIKIGKTGGVIVEKTQAVNTGTFAIAPAQVVPGDTLKYKIIATNTYNAPVFNFKLIDNGSTALTSPIAVASNNTFTYTNFVSANVDLTGFDGQTPALVSKTVYYSVDGGVTFTTTVPTKDTVTAAKGIQIAVDTDGSKTITAADVVPSGATITLTINTTVK